MVANLHYVMQVIVAALVINLWGFSLLTYNASSPNVLPFPK